jgi:hypothetical protein
MHIVVKQYVLLAIKHKLIEQEAGCTTLGENCEPLSLQFLRKETQGSQEGKLVRPNLQESGALSSKKALTYGGFLCSSAHTRILFGFTFKGRRLAMRASAFMDP